MLAPLDINRFPAVRKLSTETKFIPLVGHFVIATLRFVSPLEKTEF